MKKILSLMFAITLFCSVAFATVTDQTQRVQYTATASQTVFAYTWRVLDDGDMDVYVDEVLTTAYTVSNVGVLTGGNITFNVGRTSGEIILILRNMPNSQETSYPAGGRLSTVNLELNLDRLTMFVQDIQESIGRSLKFPPPSSFSDIDVPVGTSATDRATKVIAWDSAGTDLELIASTNVDATSVIAVKGDIVQGSASGDAEKLGIGAAGSILKVAVTSGKLAYLPIGSPGDTLQVNSGGGSLEYLSIGSTGGLLHVSSGALAYLSIGSTGEGLITSSGNTAWGVPAIPNYRSGFNCSKRNTGTTVIRVLAGTIEVDGTMVTVTTATELDLATATNWVDDTSHQAVDTYFYIYINAAGTVEFDDQAPDASDISDNTDGLLRYNNTGTDTSWRRCIGSFLTNATGSGELDDDSVFSFDEKVGLGGGYIRLHDSKATTVDGGTFTSGAFQKRTCTEDKDTGNNVAVASSVITLEAGTYDCLISCPAYRVDTHGTRLRNTSDTTTVLVGTSARTDNLGATSNLSVISGRFRITAQKTLEIQHRCSTTFSSAGFGVANSFGENEVYTVAEFWKIAP